MQTLKSILKNQGPYLMNWRGCLAEILKLSPTFEITHAFMETRVLGWILSDKDSTNERCFQSLSAYGMHDQLIDLAFLNVNFENSNFMYKHYFDSVFI